MKKINPTVYFFYGATGSGKTLSTIKFSTRNLKSEMKKILISNDIYHIGAQKKIQIYADLIGCDFWHLPTEEILKKKDELLAYDEIYFDYFFKNDNFDLEKIESHFYHSFFIKRIFVVNVFMLPHDKMINCIYTKNNKPDEYIITFFDYYRFFNKDIFHIIEDRIEDLNRSCTVWISDGQLYKDLHQYKKKGDICF